MGLSGFQGGVIDALNKQDERNQELLDQVVDAANAVTANDQLADVTAQDAMKSADINHDGKIVGEAEIQAANNMGFIAFGGKIASVQGTGGVALLEFAKDAIQTAVSNISGMGTNQSVARKTVERKLSALG